MRHWMGVVLGIIIIGVVGCTSQRHPEAERQAVESAQRHPEAERQAIESAQRRPEAERNVIDSVQAWLELVDHQQYPESWEDTTDYFPTDCMT